MQSARILSLFSAAALLAAPLSVMAHETQQFQIGDKTYQFVIGSLNEPVAVDDKTGLDLTVSLVPGGAPDEHDHADESQPHEHAAPAPVLGLEKTLKVEMQAGETKKEFAVSVQHGKPGAYKTTFYPTVQTTFTYRLFGSIEGTPVDLSFPCNPAGHPATPEDTSAVKVSDAVTRVLKRGSFGCPAAKSDLGFPEPSATMAGMTQESGDPLPIAAIALSVVALAASGGSMMRRKQ